MFSYANCLLEELFALSSSTRASTNTGVMLLSCTLWSSTVPHCTVSRVFSLSCTISLTNFYTLRKSTIYMHCIIGTLQNFRQYSTSLRKCIHVVGGGMNAIRYSVAAVAPQTPHIGYPVEWLIAAAYIIHRECTRFTFTQD